jgi:hypothetical protein
MSTDEKAEPLKFVVDLNVAKLARWLRMMGYDTTVFDGQDDWQMVRLAQAEDRVVITRDTGVMKRRIITSGRLQAHLVASDDPEKQLEQVIYVFKLDDKQSFSRCIECNELLAPCTLEEVKDRVPLYVFKTHKQFVECPVCHRVYWRGTHWQAMLRKLDMFRGK